MQVLKKLEGLVFYFSLFSISIQLGKHFWPDFSFVNGVRVDYLSPTLYLSDIFVLILLFLVLVNRPLSLFAFLSKSIILPIFLISLLVSSFLATSQDASFFWSLKVIEIIFFGWYVSQFNFSKGKFTKVVDILIIAAVVQSIIAIGQFFLQHSIGGLLYFLGERAFDISTIGIATFFTSGKELLRPYGTFPHPNVLAFFLSIVLILSGYYLKKAKTPLSTYLYIVSLFLIFFALLLTASRVILFLTLIIGIISYIKSRKTILYIFFVLVLIIPIYLLVFSGRFLTLTPIIDAITIRWSLIKINWDIFNENLLFGVGVSNVFYENINNSLPIYARFQPVHNIYLLILVQLGLFGAFSVRIFFYRLFRRLWEGYKLKKRPFFEVCMLIVELLIVGLFDHFFITVQQGMLMTALLVGLIFNDSMERV